MSGLRDQEQDLLRVPPQDLEAEQAVLGAMLLSKDAVLEVCELLTAGSFYVPAHGVIFDVIVSMTARGDRADPITVGAQLLSDGTLVQVGGGAYLHTLVHATPTAAMAASYAGIVADRELLRAVVESGTRAVASAMACTGSAQEVAEAAVEDMRAARDRGLAGRDEPPMDVLDFIAEADDEPDWVIPGVLARWDRLMITGGEGSGKSLLIRQVLTRAAAGLHPWRKARIQPVRALLIDSENNKSQARPWMRYLVNAASQGGAPVSRGNLIVDIMQKMLNLTVPADRAWLARRVEAVQPDIIGLGPLYKLSGGNPNDEEAARALMSALEMIRTVSGGAAMLIEAHSPHQAVGTKVRNMRPIGSSLWLRWPEFGFGLSPAEGLGAKELRLKDWVPWRGARSVRDWPEQFFQGQTWPWQAVQYAGNIPLPATTVTVDEAVKAGLLPDQTSWNDEEIG